MSISNIHGSKATSLVSLLARWGKHSDYEVGFDSECMRGLVMSAKAVLHSFLPRGCAIITSPLFITAAGGQPQTVSIEGSLKDIS